MFARLKSSLSNLVDADKEDAEPSGLSACSPRDQAMLKTWGVTTEQENKLLEEFRAELSAAVALPPWADDHCLRRFLRARKHSLTKAKQMFLDQLEWRKANDVDSVLNGFHFTERERFFEFYPEGFYCTDRTGRPVYIQQPGKVNTDELWKFTNLERCVRYHIQQQERYLNVIVPSAALATGRRQEQSIVLIDMDGVGVSTLTGEVRKILALVMNIDQDNYPELMWKTLIINAPTTFRVLWAMVRHLLDARTQAKIQVLPSDYKEALQEYIAPENLMQQYGGTNPAPLFAEPGPWQDPAIQAQLTAKGRKWAEGLAEDEREEVGALPAVPEGEDVDSVMLSGGSRLLVGRPASPDKAPPGAGGGGAASGGGSATAAGAAAAAGGGEG